MSPAVAEAIAWIEQAEALLDQAQAALKGTGLDQVTCDSGYAVRVNIARLRTLAVNLITNIRTAAEEKD